MTLGYFSPSSCKGELGINRDGEGAARVEQVSGGGPQELRAGHIRPERLTGQSVGTTSRPVSQRGARGGVWMVRDAHGTESHRPQDVSRGGVWMEAGSHAGLRKTHPLRGPGEQPGARSRTRRV